MSTVSILFSAAAFAGIQLTAATTISFPRKTGTVLTYHNPNLPNEPLMSAPFNPDLPEFPREIPLPPFQQLTPDVPGRGSSVTVVDLPPVDAPPAQRPRDPLPRPDPRPLPDLPAQKPSPQPRPNFKPEPNQGGAKPEPPSGGAAARSGPSFADRQTHKHSFSANPDMKMTLNTQFQVAVAIVLAMCVGCTMIKYCFCTSKEDKEYMRGSRESVVTDNDIDWSDDTDAEEPDEHMFQSRKAMEPVPDDSVYEDRLEIQEAEVEDDMEYEEEDEQGQEQLCVDMVTDDETRAIMQEFRDSDEEYAQ